MVACSARDLYLTPSKRILCPLVQQHIKPLHMSLSRTANLFYSPELILRKSEPISTSLTTTPPHRNHGSHVLKDLRPSLGKEGDENFDGWFGCCRKDYYSLQAEAW
jgi:hypothetical protein